MIDMIIFIINVFKDNHVDECIKIACAIDNNMHFNPPHGTYPNEHPCMQAYIIINIKISP